MNEVLKKISNFGERLALKPSIGRAEIIWESPLTFHLGTTYFGNLWSEFIQIFSINLVHDLMLHVKRQ